MEFGAILPTVDIFEALCAIALVPGIWASIYNVRESWAEKEWAIDSPDPSIRRLGENRWENAQALFAAMVIIAICVLSALLVPSPLQVASPASVDFQDVFNATLQRIGLLLVVLLLTRKCLNDALWRRYVANRRRKAAQGGLTASRENARSVTDMPSAIQSTESALDRHDDVQAPVVVVPPVEEKE